MSVKIHAIKTGEVRVKSAQPERKTGGLIRILADDNWADWLPIYAWVIEHPEGVFVVDTGETARTMNEPGYFPKWHPYYRTSVRTNITADEEIGPQLKKMGIDTTDVKKVILTHFHTDHAGGLHHFPESQILVSGKDYHLAKGILGKALGYLPQHWPRWFNPIPVPFENDKFGPFERSFPITSTGDIWAIPTPGHTPNHISVVVRSEDILYFLAGDTTYSEELLIENVPDGVSPRPAITLNTMAKIRELAEMEPTVYLPAHDEQSRDRLEQKSILFRESVAETSAA
jgi:glyoxylase-like metal-dependent hydrolase (beta-lactamase superfamily II)